MPVTQGLPSITETDPIVYKVEREALSRIDAINKLGLSSCETNIYIQLGAGNINDIGQLEKKIIEICRERKNTRITIGDSPISMNKEYNTTDIKRLTYYPNSVFFSAFDILFLAAGYNSAHEAAYLSRPTVFFPNESTGSDNQTARAENISSYSPAVVVKKIEDSREDILKFLAEHSKVDENKKARKQLFTNGARQAATTIMQVHSGEKIP